MSEGNRAVEHLIDMKGIGKMNAVTIVSEIGDITQSHSVLKLQSYKDKCPAMTGSGGKTYLKKLTKNRNEYLSNVVHQSAVFLVNQRNWEFYDLFNREVDKRKTNTEAYIVIGKRLLFHIFSMMKNQKPHRERIPRERPSPHDLLECRPKQDRSQEIYLPS